MISKSLSTSRKYAALYVEAGVLAEFCQALFPLLVAHADDFGRLPGDVFTVRHLVLPISPRTLEEFNEALGALDHVGLIQRYHKRGADYIQIVHFDEHQTGLHHRTKSKIPRADGNSGKFPESSEQLKGIEENLTEQNGSGKSGSDKAPSEARLFLIWFQEEYKTRRNGAIYFVAWQKHMAMVKRLLTAFPQERLRKLASVLLTTDEDWTAGTDRGIEILVARINWLEERLCAWEVKRKAREAV